MHVYKKKKCIFKPDKTSVFFNLYSDICIDSSRSECSPNSVDNVRFRNQSCFFHSTSSTHNRVKHWFVSPKDPLYEMPMFSSSCAMFFICVCIWEAHTFANLQVAPSPPGCPQRVEVSFNGALQSCAVSAARPWRQALELLSAESDATGHREKPWMIG